MPEDVVQVEADFRRKKLAKIIEICKVGRAKCRFLPCVTCEYIEHCTTAQILRTLGVSINPEED